MSKWEKAIGRWSGTLSVLLMQAAPFLALQQVACLLPSFGFCLCCSLYCFPLTWWGELACGKAPFQPTIPTTTSSDCCSFCRPHLQSLGFFVFRFPFAATGSFTFLFRPSAAGHVVGLSKQSQ